MSKRGVWVGWPRGYDQLTQLDGDGEPIDWDRPHRVIRCQGCRAEMLTEDAVRWAPMVTVCRKCEAKMPIPHTCEVCRKSLSFDGRDEPREYAGPATLCVVCPGECADMHAVQREHWHRKADKTAEFI